MGDTTDHTISNRTESRVAALPVFDERACLGFRSEEVEAQVIEPRGRPVLRHVPVLGLIKIEHHTRRALGQREDARHRDPGIRLGGPAEKLLALQVREDPPAIGRLDERIEIRKARDRAVAVDPLARA